jgi:hypothetical protein
MSTTWLQPEEFAYPAGGQTRKGAAVYPDGRIRRVWAGIPDTFFSIPAHGRIKRKYLAGFLTCDDGIWTFHVYEGNKNAIP